MATGPEGGRLVQGLAAAGGTERGSPALPGCRAPVRGDLSLRSCRRWVMVAAPQGFGPFPSCCWMCFQNSLLPGLWSPLGMTGAGKTQFQFPHSAAVLAEAFCVIHLPRL